MDSSFDKNIKKRKRNVLTLSDKIEIIKCLEKGENREKLMNRFNIGSYTLYDIKNSKQKILDFASHRECEGGIEKRKTLHKPKLEQLDSILFDWFSLKRSEGMPITGPLLIEKTKFFYEELKIKESCSFSVGWLNCFKARHGIRKLDISGEKKSADEYAAQNYCKKILEIVKKYNLSREQVCNADETGLLWRCLPNSTLAGKNEATAAGFKHNKNRLTVLTCANAAGTHRLDLLVIGKSRRPRGRH